MSHQRRFEQLDLLAGLQAKAEGQALRIEHNPHWNAAAVDVIRLVAREVEFFTADDLREAIMRRVGPPDHKNSWGSAVTAAAKRKIIQQTGRMTKTRRRVGHARAIPIWTRGPNA